MSEITKEEVLALIDVNTKTATQLQAIAISLSQIVDKSEKIINVASDAVATSKTNKDSLARVEKVVDDTKNGVFWIQVIFGSIAFLTAIVGGIMAFSHHLATMAGKG